MMIVGNILQPRSSTIWLHCSNGLETHKHTFPLDFVKIRQQHWTRLLLIWRKDTVLLYFTHQHRHPRGYYLCHVRLVNIAVCFDCFAVSCPQCPWVVRHKGKDVDDEAKTLFSIFDRKCLHQHVQVDCSHLNYGAHTAKRVEYFWDRVHLHLTHLDDSRTGWPSLLSLSLLPSHPSSSNSLHQIFHSFYYVHSLFVEREIKDTVAATTPRGFESLDKLSIAFLCSLLCPFVLWYFAWLFGGGERWASMLSNVLGSGGLHIWKA